MKTTVTRIIVFFFFFFFFCLPHQTSFLLYKCRFDEVNFTRRCFHDVDDFNKFKEEGLPSIEIVHSKLTSENISDYDYNHAENVLKKKKKKKKKK